MGDAAIEGLPDPDLFRDAQFLAHYGRMSPAELDATDWLVIALMWRLRRT